MKDAPGPVYVASDCCITCGVPWTAAPDNFAYDEPQATCVVTKQPTNGKELAEVLEVLDYQEVDCIRVRAGYLTFRRLLEERGLGHLAD